MKKLLFLATLLPILFVNLVSAQYSNLGVSVDKTKFCDQAGVIQVSGTVRANTNVSNGYHFTGMIFRFYYFTGGAQIGYYTVNLEGSTTTTSHANLNPTYFDGTKLSGGQVTANTYDASSPMNGGMFSASVTVPWTAFPTSTGVQFWVAVEAIDNTGSTTTVSPKTQFDNPILYNKSAMAAAATISSSPAICNGSPVFLATNPDLSASFNYQWYKDGSPIPGETGREILGTAGTYYVYIYDECQSQSSTPIVISSGNAPPAPSVSVSGSTVLCNGASATLTTSPSGGGTIYWNTGQSGNSIVITGPGNYYAYEVNNCGAGPNSNNVSVSTGSTPSAPSISSSNGSFLCNGATTTLSGLPPSGGTLNWSTGATGNAITVSSAGSYYVYEVNSCGTGPNSNTITLTAGATPSAPAVTSGNGTILCNGATTTLSSSPFAGGTINWSTGTTGNTITVSTAGSYYAYEVNSCGTGPNSNTVIIGTGNKPLAPSISNSTGTLLCNGSFTNLSGSPSAGGTLGWSTGTTGNAITVGSAGSYYAYEVNNCGTGPNSNIITLTSGTTPSAPAITSSNGTMLCNGASTTLSGSPSYGGNLQWSTSVAGNSITVNTLGSFYAYEVNSCGTGPRSNTITVTTGNSPATPAITPAGPIALCNGNSVTLSIPGGGNTNWFLNGGLVAANGGTLSVSSAGFYTATLNNACGVSGVSAVVNVTTGAAPTAPVVSSSNGTMLCTAQSTLLTTTPSAGGTINWSTGQTGNSITVNSVGSYYCYEVSTCGSSANSSPVSITMNSIPPAPVLNASGNTLLCDGEGKTVTTSPVTQGGSIRWTSGLTGNTITYYNAGNYFAYETNGCGDGPQTVFSFTTLSKPAAPSVSPAGNMLLCNGVSGSFVSTGSGITWSNGATGNTMTTATAGSYYSYATNVCGNSPNSNVVNVSTVTCPTPSPGSSFFICPGAQKLLDAGSGYNSYTWSNGATTQTITAGPGTYSVTVSKSGCTATSAAVTVSYYTVTAPTINASGSTTLCAGGNVVLTSSAGSAYSWSTGSTANNIAVTTTGNYFVTVTDANGCVAASSPTTVTVNPLATATIAGSTTVCQNASQPSMTFSASGGTAPYTFSYTLNGGSQQTISTTTGNSISIPVSTTTTGNYVYTLVNVKESSSTACDNPVSGTAIVTVRSLPTATIAGSTTVCKNSTSPKITFSGSGGMAPYTFTYSVNSGAPQTITTISGSSATVDVPTGSAGTLVYALINVSESGTGNCSKNAEGSARVIVKDLPTVTVSGNATVCQNSSFPLISITGSTGTAPYTFTYKLNGGVDQNITTVSGNSITLPVPTNTAGSFSYSLVSIKEGSGRECINAAVGSATVIVRPLPGATITGTTRVCQNAIQPVVTFTGNTGIMPYTFTYTLNNGSSQTITTVSGNSVSVTVPTNIAGTFTYSLVSVKESGTNTCLNNVTGSVIVTVNPQPTAPVIASPQTHLCNGEAGQLTIVNWDEGNTYTWFKGGEGFMTSVANSITATQTGTYHLTAISNMGCSAAGISNSITVTTGSISQPIITGFTKVCPGGKATLTVLPTKKSMEYETWRWTDTPLGDTVNRDSRFSAVAGQYKVFVARQGCADSAAVAVTSDDTEFPAGRLQVKTSSIKFGQPARFVADVTGAVKYEWDFGDGNRATTTNNEVAQNYYVVGDSIRIKLEAFSSRNCITTFTARIKVSPQDSLRSIDHSFTGNLKDWNLFPTPFHDNLKLSVVLERNQPVRLDFFIADGSWVQGWIFQGTKGENLFTLDKIDRLMPNVLYFATSIYNNVKHFDKVFKY